MAINNGYLYVADTANNVIFSCPLTTDSNTPNSFSCTSYSPRNSQNVLEAANPRGIAIYNNYLYFTNFNFNTSGSDPGIATICSINSGSLSSCSNAGIDVSLLNGSSHPAGVTAFNGHLYITDQSTNNYILVCTINNTNGSLSDCSRTASGITGTPIGISIF